MLQHPPELGTPFGSSEPDNFKPPKAMLSQVKKYLQVKREAMRLMMAGDVDHYMRKLREMQALRPQAGQGLATN